MKKSWLNILIFLVILLGSISFWLYSRKETKIRAVEALEFDDGAAPLKMKVIASHCSLSRMEQGGLRVLVRYELKATGGWSIGELAGLSLRIALYSGAKGYSTMSSTPLGLCSEMRETLQETGKLCGEHVFHFDKATAENAENAEAIAAVLFFDSVKDGKRSRAVSDIQVF